MKTWLVLDAPFLCCRNYFAFGGKLFWKEVPTSVLFGFFRDLVSLSNQFATSAFAFCWDWGPGLREQCYPIYKAKRRLDWETLKEKALEEKWAREEVKSQNALKEQMRLLRLEFIPRLGYLNNFSQKGYESDDMIASVCLNLPRGDEAIIISADKDLYQLITDRISFYNPISKKSVTLQSFYEQWKIQPKQWADVKGIAGCTTDEVPGVIGVAEKLAARYLTGKLTGKKAKDIQEFQGTLLRMRNAQLVHLPYQGTKKCEVQEDSLDVKEWGSLMLELGMQSLRKQFPIARREYVKGRGTVKCGKA